MTKSLKNADLISRTEFLAGEERRITLELIECLEEISRRMIYAELGYSSLYEFCTKYLLMSEGSAHRRISAMRLARDVPQVKEQLSSGALSLSNAAKIENSIRRQSPTQKHAVVSECLNMTQKECESKLFALVPGLKDSVRYTEKVRSIDETHSELKLIINAELKAKIDELQNLNSHADTEKSYVRLIERLVDAELAKQKEKRKVRNKDQTTIGKDSARGQSTVTPALPKNTGQEKSNTESRSGAEAKEASAQLKDKPTNPAAGKVPFKRTSVPAAIQRLVWTRANHQCQYKGCHSRYQLEIEHLKPVALGGTNAPDNLQLLCRTHNLFRARMAFGAARMDQFRH